MKLKEFNCQEKAPTYRSKPGTNNQGASTTPISTPTQALSGQNQNNLAYQEKAPAYRNKPGTNNQGASTTPISTPTQALSG